MTLVVQPHLFAANTLISLDSASQFYPWYAFMGESLRAGHIPGWNPAMFSGTPFAANPLSGWTYLPAMVLFALLPLAVAAKAYLLFHPLLAGWSSFALARALGLSRFGALVAALAYANTGFLQIQNSCCFAFASVYAWLPLALFGAERAIRSTDRVVRAAWWGLAALALSQIVAAWLGQGSYYASLIIGAYIACRVLLAPRSIAPLGLWMRIACVLQHEVVVFGFGAALAAAGLLPRIEFISLSNLDGGYQAGDGRVGGLRPEQWLYLVTPGMWYVGASVLVLAAAAPFVVRRRSCGAVWYFGVASLIALVLTDTFETPLDRLLYYLLPGFEHLHPHAPERILTVAFLGPALLAGATISAFQHTTWWMQRHRGSAFVRAAVVVLAVVIITVDLGLAGAQARAARSPRDPLDGIATLASVDLGSYYQPGGAASFLQAQLAASPFRFLGYAPDVDGRMLAYTVRSFDASTAALLVNNRAVALGLQDVQGYDASHLRRYDDYLAVLNGQTQNYHDAEVFPHGLTSPLLDLLNTRYVIVPRARTEASPVLHRYLQVYADEQVTILENLSALPRAWIVHTATQADPDAASPAELLTTGDVDGRLMAILEQPPPALEFPANPSLDRADLTDYQADSLSLRTYSEASGLVVLSEIYYPSWTAYVDGNPTRLYVADGVLRAVPVPAGEHRVELRFESATLEYGVFISLIASIVLMLLALAALSTRTCRPPLGNAAQPTFAAIARVAVHYRQRIVRSASGSSRELSGLAPRRTP